MYSEHVTIRFCGKIFTIPIEPYSTIREVVCSRAFLDVTTVSPNELKFFVNGQPVRADLLLVDGDRISAQTTGEKAAITPRDAIKKLQKMVGLAFASHGGNHDKWRTKDGRLVVFPRHARDLATGTLKSIIKKAGLDMSLDEFMTS